MSRIGNIQTPISIQLPEPGMAARMSFQSGRLLTAIVRSAMDSGLVLDINGETIQARTDLALSTGATLTLQVMRTQPDVLLKVIGDTSAQSTVRQLLRQILPRQKSLPESLRPLRTLAERADVRGRLPEAVRHSLESLLARIPVSEQVAKPDKVRRILEESGVFMESHLSTAGTQAAETSAADFKAALLRLLSALQQDALPEDPLPRSDSVPKQDPRPIGQPRPFATEAEVGNARSGSASTTEATRLIENGRLAELLSTSGGSGTHADTVAQLLQHAGDGLARLQLMQLHAASQAGGRIDWLFELPVLHGNRMDVVQLRIQEDEDADGGRSESTSRVFQVHVFFDFENTGQLAATIRLHGERVNTSWWAERPETVQLINRELPKFEAVLKEAGLAPGHVGCRQGRPTRPSDELPILRQGILDEKA